jgi:hypothetical protein
MLEPPDHLYGVQLDSNYQGQIAALGKHFKRVRDFADLQAQLFDGD